MPSSFSRSTRRSLPIRAQSIDPFYREAVGLAFAVSHNVCIVLLTLVVAAIAQKQMNSGIVYGPGFSYVLNAPKGWTLDNKQGKDDGLSVVFYRNGQSWTKGLSVMYSRAEEKGKMDLAAYISRDLKGFKEHHPGGAYSKVDGIKALDGSLATVYDFHATKGASNERVAYLSAPKVFVMVVLTSRDPKDFQSATVSFGELVKSYSYLGKAIVK